MIALLLTLFGCPGPDPEPECRDAGDCDGLALCTSDGTCLAVECLSSEHCPMEHTCDADAHTCAPGCGSDDDCLSGSACDVDAGVCAPLPCSDTQLDCGLGETCDVDVGSCGPTDGLCLPCDGDGWDVCRDEIGGECRWFGDAYYCTPPCDPAGPENDRPRAFDCLDVAGGSVERWRLWGDCPAYIAQQTPDESPT